MKTIEGQKVTNANSPHSIGFGSGWPEKAMTASNGPVPTISGASPNQNIFASRIVPRLYCHFAFRRTSTEAFVEINHLDETDSCWEREIEQLKASIERLKAGQEQMCPATF
jgi:hypothetical protein